MSRAPRLPESTEVLIIGAGLAGASTAHALLQQGHRPLLLERFPSPGHESSSRSAGMIRAHSSDEETRRFTEAGAALHRESRLAKFEPTGSVLLGLGNEPVSSSIPWAEGKGLVCPGDGVVDAEELLSVFLAGQDVCCDVTVESFETEGDSLRVRTSQGDIRARIVVNAAGAWAGVLGELPLRPLNRHLFLTQDRPAGDCEPFVWDVEEGFYFRRVGKGLLLCSCDEEEREPGDNRVAAEAESHFREKARRLQPQLAELPLSDSWSGQRTFAPDRRFVIGWDPRWRGLFHVAGLGGHGVTASPALGHYAAALITRGPDNEDPDGPLSPARLLR